VRLCWRVSGVGINILSSCQVAGQKSRGHPEKRMQLTSSPSSRDAAYIFQELQASCESQYLESPGVLTKVLKLMEGQLNDYKVELVHDDNLGMVMRAAESRILPFDFELVTQEFWDATPGLARANSTEIRVRSSELNTSYLIDECSTWSFLGLREVGRPHKDPVSSACHLRSRGRILHRHRRGTSLLRAAPYRHYLVRGSRSE
jgi:hypothetical protein